MDFISLCLTFGITGTYAKTARTALAACIGAVGGVVSAYFGLSGFLSLLSGIVLSVIMVAVAAGKCAKRRLVLLSVILWGAGALIAGAVSLICSFGDGGKAAEVSGQSSFFVLAAGALAASFIWRVISSRRAAREAKVEITAFGETVRLTGLVDSGNLSVEPISGAPVIFASVSLFSSSEARLIFKGTKEAASLPNEAAKRCRTVSVGTVNGERLILAFFPDEVFIEAGKERKRVRAAVAFGDEDALSGHDAIVPARLCDF